MKQRWIAIGATVLVSVVVIALIAVGYRFNWTGFNRYISPQLKPNQQYQPEKTLWDWLQLLIVPVMLALAGFWFTQIQKSREQRTTKRREKIERDLALDNQRESALQGYTDRLSELLLKRAFG